MQNDKAQDAAQLNELMQQIDEHMTASRYVPALKLALETLKIYPHHGEIHCAAGFCYTELRNFKAARKHIQIALKLGPDERLPHYTNARWHLRKHKFKQAEAILLQLCKLHPILQNQLELYELYKSMYAANCFIIKRYWALKKIHVKMLATLDVVATQFNAPLLAAKLKAEFFIYIKAYKLAHAALEECIALDPSDAWAYFFKTYLYLLNYQPSQGKRFLQDGLRLKPNDAMGLRLFAIIKAKGIPEYRNRFTKYVFKLGHWLIFIPSILLCVGMGMPPLLLGALVFLGANWKRIRVNKTAKALARLELKKDF